MKRPAQPAPFRRASTSAAAIALAAILTLSATETLSAASVFGLPISEIHLSVMPTWIYNGYTQDADGRPVQGSDVGPMRFTLGGGLGIDTGTAGKLRPSLWIYRQEYIALNDHDKVVPTQIETGSVVGDIADTLGVALSIPWVYTFTAGWAPEWEFAVGGGVAFVFRVPVAGIDGSDAGPVGSYWIAGRFVYPQVDLTADYRLNPRLSVGVGATWYLPIYNLWDDGEATPFLDETMVRGGLRVTWGLGGM